MRSSGRDVRFMGLADRFVVGGAMNGTSGIA